MDVDTVPDVARRPPITPMLADAPSEPAARFALCDVPRLSPVAGAASVDVPPLDAALVQSPVATTAANVPPLDAALVQSLVAKAAPDVPPLDAAMVLSSVAQAAPAVPPLDPALADRSIAMLEALEKRDAEKKALKAEESRRQT